ncbi:alpha-amylase family glycosyl hydrolase [Massilia sp. Root335]|uniref:alpha-amylase family glycosyl hydrolase n=1 Tax=Massilia sp. Root335 TaxID=1736517 RepID=UPI0006FBDEFD|nr:alpha-amylase family glycosyl hydrolase [Massilia sp. Root335]KQV51810.1 alpha-amylase [Massilia sp. Root335]
MTHPTFHDNPIVYHILTDRFCDPAREHGLTRVDGDAIGTFHGGKLAGITRKIEEDWFCALGVNAILISAPYEQIRGWVPGEGGFRHYAYHGYYALDYTLVDARLGTAQDLKNLVDAAHRRGIRVLLDIVLNHPGYPDLDTMHALDIPVLKPGWRDATPATYFDYLDKTSAGFAAWWGPDWVRGDYPGYPAGGGDDLTMLLSGLPDFRTESEACVRLPAFLANKPGSKARDLPGTTVRGYLVEWLTAWVRDFGIDGFRCDSARHVELDAWYALKEAATTALADWKRAHPAEAIDTAPFWMTGEVFGHGIERSDYFDFGFDNLINFQFPAHLARAPDLDTLYRAYAKRLAGRPDHDVLSYVSSHDTRLCDRGSLIAAGTALLLAPGGVLILYGDETARPPGPCTPADPAQATRSDMNWDRIDVDVLAHWRKLGRFRARHVALARGTHACLQKAPHVFARIDACSGDRVVVAPEVRSPVSIPVSGVFAEGERLCDAYSGRHLTVRHGRVDVESSGCVLLESAAAGEARP